MTALIETIKFLLSLFGLLALALFAFLFYQSGVIPMYSAQKHFERHKVQLLDINRRLLQLGFVHVCDTPIYTKKDDVLTFTSKPTASPREQRLEQQLREEAQQIGIEWVGFGRKHCKDLDADAPNKGHLRRIRYVIDSPWWKYGLPTSMNSIEYIHGNADWFIREASTDLMKAEPTSVPSWYAVVMI